MSNIKDFQVNYRLNVQAADAVTQLKNFTSAVSGLAAVDNTLTKAASSLKTMSSSLKSVFGANGNKKYTLKIDTKTAEANIDRLMSKLSSLEDRMKGMSMGFGGMGHGSGATMNRNIQRNMDAYARETKKAAQKAYSKYGVTPFGMGAYTGSAPKGIGGWGYPSGYAPRGKNRDAWKSGAQTVPFYPVGGDGGAVPPVSGGKGGAKGGGKNSAQTAAINRLHYSNMPSWRNIPFAGLLNAYFMYNAVRNEIGDAVSFTHTMESAKNILAATDNDVATFADRFKSMTSSVRKIGVDTKFTMVEMADATQTLAKAGFGVDQIKNVIRPVTDLALVSDSPIEDIARQISSIMHGYGIDTRSSSQVADVLTNSSVRSMVDISDLAETMKMAAGFLNMAGVSFNEGIAAAAVLGNNGIRGTLGGTSLRSMLTFIAKPTKQAQKVMDQLGVSFTETKDVYGEKKAVIRSLADIMEDLNKAGAGTKEMAAIFGKVGGTGAMYLVNHYDQLRDLTESNRYANGLAHELGEKKQNTTFGLWEQVTSQWSESFTRAFERMEPAIQSILKKLTASLGTTDFINSITKIGQSMLAVFDIVTRFGLWFASNWSWIEPLFITGVVARTIFKTAGAFANLATAMGLAGRASSIMGLSGLVGGAAQTAQAVGGASAAVGGLGRTLASTVNTGSGITGAAAALGAFGTSAIVATGAISALVGLAAYAGTKIYELYQKKEALTEEHASRERWIYPSLDALNSSLEKAYVNAVRAKGAKDALTQETVGEAYGNVTGGGTYDWLNGKSAWLLGTIGKGVQYGASQTWDWLRAGFYAGQGNYVKSGEINKQMDDRRKNFHGYYNYDEQNKFYNMSMEAVDEKAAGIASETFKYVVKNSSTPQEAFESLKVAKKQFETAKLTEDKSLYYTTSDGLRIIHDDFEDRPKSATLSTPYAVEAYDKVIGQLDTDKGYLSKHRAYINMISSQENASRAIFSTSTGFTPAFLTENGFQMINGKWQAPTVPHGAPKEEAVRIKAMIDNVKLMASGIVYDGLYDTFKDRDAVSNIFKAAGFDYRVYGTDPTSNDSILNQNGMHQTDEYGNPVTGSGGGISSAGGNYGGAGRMNSVAPKQVNVTIENLMSIETIELMGTDAGKTAEMQNLKETVTQLLIEVVHDFDSSWHG